MAKLFKLEKEMRDLLLITQVDEPYGFVYDNPFKGFGYNGVLNSKSEYYVQYDFYNFGKNYLCLSLYVGTRLYTCLFYEEDYDFVRNLVEKFIRVNSI